MIRRPRPRGSKRGGEGGAGEPHCSQGRERNSQSDRHGTAERRAGDLKGGLSGRRPLACPEDHGVCRRSDGVRGLGLRHGMRRLEAEGRYGLYRRAAEIGKSLSK